MTATRGRSRQKNWKRPDMVAVIALELDLSASPAMRRRVERHFDAAFRLQRTLQRDAESACTAYMAARHERKAAGPKAVRARLGLDRKGTEARAKAHIERAGWMRDHLTKATGLHIADRVWESADRFLFPDKSGRRLLLAACVTVTDPDDPKTARLDPALREHARALVTAGLIKDFPVTGEETAQQEGPLSRSTIRHNPETGTGGDGSVPETGASAGQGERPAQPRKRNHGRPWGQQRNRRTSQTRNDPQAALASL